MGFGKVTVTVVLTLAIGVGFLVNRQSTDGVMNKPFPDDIPNPFLTRVILSIVKAVFEMANILSHLGFGEEYVLKRRLMDMILPPPDHSGLKVTDIHVDGVKARLYIPEGIKQGAPAVVLYHGGGWYFCSIDTHDLIAANLARRLQAVVLSVDYRLAPEHHFPIPLDDCTTATKYFINHASEYGVDPKRIAVAGDSAGGNLAATVSLRLRDEKFTPMPRVQVLVYPVVQVTDLGLPSYKQNSDVFFGNSKGVARCFAYYSGVDVEFVSAMASGNHTTAKMKQELISLRKYLPKKYVEDYPAAENVQDGDPHLMKIAEPFLTNPYMFPLMASDLSGLPEAYVATAEYDILRDEGIMYAKRLLEANVKVTLVNSEDGFHGIWNYQQKPFSLKSGERMMDEMVKFLANTL